MQTKSSKKLALALASSLLIAQGCGGGGGSETPAPVKTPAPTPAPELPKLSVSTVEAGSAIYLDGIYTGAVTPADIEVAAGEHTVGIGLINSKTYLKKSVTVEDTTDAQSIILDDNDLQAPKTWKALFVGINKATVANGSCVSEYTTEELDAGYEFFKWSFEERVEDYSYNTSNWEFDRIDISDEVFTLNYEALVTPNEINPYLESFGVKKGDYDFIVTFFRGGDVLSDAGPASGQGCELGEFRGIGWFDYDILNVDASYVTIRYWDNIVDAIAYSKEDERDPGMFIHEWLHTVAETNGNGFFAGQGYAMPSSGNNVVHAAENYNYAYPWMTWYQDMIGGKVKKNDNYIGITPEAFLACTVREHVIGLCE